MARAVAATFQPLAARWWREERDFGGALELLQRGLARAAAGARRPRWSTSKRSTPSMVSSISMITARSTTFLSSRTLPGHGCRASRASAAGLQFLGRRLYSAQNCLGEMLDQGRDVLRVLAQGRRLQHHHRQPEVEVLAEVTGGHGAAEVLVGGGDDADVDGERPFGADRLDLAVLQDPQHLGLGLEAHVADLVEEDRPAVRLDELADLAPVGAGERALLVTEELGLDELLGNRGAVDPDERLARPIREVMQPAGNQLFAGARLTEDQDRGVGRRHPRDLLAESAHGPAVAEQRRWLVVVARAPAPPCPGPPRRARRAADRRGRAVW